MRSPGGVHAELCTGAALRQLAAAVDRRLTIQHAVEAGKRHLDFFTIVPCHSELLGSMNLMIEMVMASVAPALTPVVLAGPVAPKHSDRSLRTTAKGCP